MEPSAVAAALQGYLDDLNAQDPADHDSPWTSSVYRHPCPASRVGRKIGRATSTAIGLHERYVTVEAASSFTEGGELPAGVRLGDLDAWALIYREGRCPRCGQTARSSVGRIVSTAERPPLVGRLGRT